MIVVTTIDGRSISVNEYSVAVVNGPYPTDNGPHTYVYGIPPSVLVTLEDAEALMQRMPAGPHFGRLTRPNGTPVWINSQYVRLIRPPLWTENPPAGNVHSVIMVGPTYHHAVIEDVPTATALLRP